MANSNYYTYKFSSLEELQDWISTHSDDTREAFYWGDWDNFEGLYTLDDLARDLDDSWFADGAEVEVYEVID